VCPFLCSGEVFHCTLEWKPVDVSAAAPPWCQLRAGDVVVTAGKDGG